MIEYKDTPYGAINWCEKTEKLRNNRYRETLNFLPEQLGKCLEIAERNPFTELLEKRAASLENTDFDLDYAYKPEYQSILPDDFDTVCIFEIIEHLLNPLSFLEWCADRIRGAKDGRLYLSTPIDKPRWMKGFNHFHEFSRDELYWLFRRASLEIVRERKVNPIPPSWMLKGVRPFLRYIHFNRTYLVELKLATKKGSA